MQKIAIVDDAADNRDFLYYLLRDEYHVLTYASGEDALHNIQQDFPDLIIMDIWLHGIDGIAVLQGIRRDVQLASIPVIALTANAMLGDREKYLAAGFDDYISKPILKMDDFLTTVRRFLAPPEPK
jgi:CheY-like chemotaxis protein